MRRWTTSEGGDNEGAATLAAALVLAEGPVVWERYASG